MARASADDARYTMSEAARLARSIGGYATAARHDPQEYTSKARETFLSRFERAVDPDGVLPLKERERRAAAERRRYFKELALKSVMARRKQ
jgi:hypothetical protein